MNRNEAFAFFALLVFVFACLCFIPRNSCSEGRAYVTTTRDGVHIEGCFPVDHLP